MPSFRPFASEDHRTKRRRLLVAIAWAWAPSRIACAAPSPRRTLVVLGDSLSAAYGLPRDSGWVTLLQRRLDESRMNVRVQNASISGETTSGGAARIDALLERERPAAVIVELGANDALRGLQLDQMKANLVRIVTACKKRSARVLLVGMRLPPNYGRAFDERFQAAFETVARGEKVDLVPFLLAGLEDRRELFQSDGLHPIAKAQPTILDHLWPAIGKLLA